MWNYFTVISFLSILSLPSSYLACHKKWMVVLLFWLVLCLLFSWRCSRSDHITSHHSDHITLITSRHSAPCDAPWVVAALGKITPLVIMFVARLPGIWASWQHHTLAGGGVGIGTSNKWRPEFCNWCWERTALTFIQKAKFWEESYRRRAMWVSPCQCWGYTRSW